MQTSTTPTPTCPIVCHGHCTRSHLTSTNPEEPAMAQHWPRRSPLESSLGMDVAPSGERIVIGLSWAGAAKLFLALHDNREIM